MKKKPALKQIEFRVSATPGSQVSVAGTFNHWDAQKNPMTDNPDSGHYKTVVAVPPGKHEYKFVINGEWCVDPHCAASAPNGCGSLNSVINVQD